MSERAEIYLEEEIDNEECTCCTTETQHQIIIELEEQVKELLNIDLDREKVYMKALETYGAEAQITMLFEEMAELQKEFCKYLREKYTSYRIDHVASIAEEVADVEIMLKQMKLLFKIEEAVERYKTLKVDRLKERLK